MKFPASLSVLGPVLLALLPTLAFGQVKAAASPWYIGGEVGASSIKLRTENINNITGSQDTRDTGYGIYTGYQFNKNWAAELGYFNLGKYTYTEPAGSLHINTHGYKITAVGLWPMTNELSLLGRLGLGSQKFRATSTTSTQSLSTTKTIPVLGLGLEYKLNTNMSLRAEYEYFGVPTFLEQGNQSIKLRTNLISIGMRYQF